MGLEGGLICLIRFSLWISRRVLKRLFSSLLSYISSRSRTREEEKSFTIVPASCGWESVGGFFCVCWWIMDWRRVLSGLFVFFEWRRFIVRVWSREVRFSRHEMFTSRWTSIDSRGVAGASSAKRRSRWRMNSAGSSSPVTVFSADRPCLTAFCEAMDLPCRVAGAGGFLCVSAVGEELFLGWHFSPALLN